MIGTTMNILSWTTMMTFRLSIYGMRDDSLSWKKQLERVGMQ